jgi:hypothetical protein
MAMLLPARINVGYLAVANSAKWHDTEALEGLPRDVAAGD